MEGKVLAYLRDKKELVDRYLRGEKSLRISKQTLGEHIGESLKAIEEIKDGKLWSFYVNTLTDRKGFKNYDEETFEKWLKFAVIFHDIGKVFYQRNFKPSTNDVIYINFRGHEFFSTYLVDIFLNLWLERDLENRLNEFKDFRWIVCSSILYHHHAMGLKSRERLDEIRVCKPEEYESIIKEIDKIFRETAKLDKLFGVDAIESFIGELMKFKSKFRKNDGYILDKRFISEVFRYIDDLNARIWTEFVKNKDFRKLMILTTTILIVLDYEGSKTRTEKLPKFYNILKEFVDLYKSISSVRLC
jgi:CRISPR-associated endonuclease Cas3-HD